MIKTVVFDMDGVIIDSEPIHMDIQEQLFSQYRIALSKEEYQAYIGRSSKNMWQELIPKFDLEITVEQVLALDKSRYHQKLRETPGISPIPGIPELLQALADCSINLILASSSTRESIDLVLQLFRLEEFFNHRISGADLTWSKPHPQIFQEAARMVSCIPEDCVVIEDSRHGVAAAKSAGMYCVGFRNPNSGDQDLSMSDLIVDDFHKLTPDIIMNFGRNKKLAP